MSDAAEKKKPGLALVISMGKGKKPDGDEPDGDEGDGEYSDEFKASCDELADTLDIAEDKRDAFCQGLYACIVAAK